ncbi:MAG: isoaspartyl peptidase/L-asparaginase [Holophagales bacterium]|nr:isoaspartyl peptidase/L-asparaginase [Holophagales bacterium]MYG29142.1 isoaspartyl peptidase/L-asparaginase [Holophagales bacterium]MYI80538.1 isoaspartyl peptidase/L-asparaginase [Holophagales bacterium]
MVLASCGPAERNENAEEQQDLNQESAAEAPPAPEWSLAIHGGAGSARRDTTDAEDYYQALRDVLSLGSEQLAAGEASLRVVEEVVAALEDDPRFNAGRGSVFTSIGTHELDAAIMDGRTLACGAVAGVKNVRNPVRLARRVMEDTPHVLLSGQGADNFAVNAGVRRNVQAYFTTEPQLERYREIRSRRRGTSSEGDGAPNPEGDYTGNAGAEPGQGGASHLGTVGAVAMDRYGNLAAATSTGGTMYKQIGRVGDVPVIGAGTYANNETAAISCTGRGEEFIRHTVAYDVSALVEYAGLSVGDAVRKVIGETLKPGDGGIIAIGRDGAIAMEFNTNAMFRGAANSLGRFDVGIWEDVRSGRP